MKQSPSSSPSSGQQVKEAFRGLEITVTALRNPEELKQIINTVLPRLTELTGDINTSRQLVTEYIFEQAGKLLGFKEHDGKPLEYSSQPFMFLTGSGSINLCAGVPDKPGTVTLVNILSQHQPSGEQEGPCVFTNIAVGERARYIGPARKEDKALVDSLKHKPNQSTGSENTTMPVMKILVRPEVARGQQAAGPHDEEDLVGTRLSFSDIREGLLNAMFPGVRVAPPPARIARPRSTKEVDLGWNETLLLPGQNVISSAGPSIHDQPTDKGDFRAHPPHASPAADPEQATQFLAALQFTPDGRAPRPTGMSEERTAFLSTAALIGTAAGEIPAHQIDGVDGGYPDLPREQFSIGQLKTALFAAQQVAAGRGGNSATLATQLLGSQPDLITPSPLTTPPPDRSSEALTRMVEPSALEEPGVKEASIFSWTFWQNLFGRNK